MHYLGLRSKVLTSWRFYVSTCCTYNPTIGEIVGWIPNRLFYIQCIFCFLEHPLDALDGCSVSPAAAGSYVQQHYGPRGKAMLALARLCVYLLYYAAAKVISRLHNKSANVREVPFLIMLLVYYCGYTTAVTNAGAKKLVAASCLHSSTLLSTNTLFAKCKCTTCCTLA